MILIYKRLASSNTSSTYPQNIVKFVPLMAEIGWPVWGTQTNFNGFRMLASLLHRCRSTDINQTLHDVWPSPGLVHYIYIFQALAPWGNFARCKIHFAPKSCALLYWQRYCTALKHWAWAKLCGVVQGMELRNFYGECHLYSAGRPSHWALAHILVAPAVRQRTFVLVQWRHDAVVLADFEVDLLRDSFRDCSRRDDDGDSCVNNNAIKDSRHCNVLCTSTATLHCVRRGLRPGDVSQRKAMQRREELKQWRSTRLCIASCWLTSLSHKPRCTPTMWKHDVIHNIGNT